VKKALGINGLIAQWINNWLLDRKQRVVINGKFSRWSDVLSGVPQGSVLGPILFIIYINDIDLGINGRILKFADDTKLFYHVGNTEDILRLRNDLHRLCQWSADWLMLFNVDKCKVMHFGFNNTLASYHIDNIMLPSCTVERDLGIIIQDNLKVSEQCLKATNTANRILGMINRTFSHKSRLLVDTLYKSLVRPHLDYCAQAWRPFLKKDIELLEKVQHRASRMVEEFRDLSYDQRLKSLGWSTLEHRRLRGDMIQVFKFIKGFDITAPNAFFNMSGTNLRGHAFKLYKSAFKTNVGKFSFSNRIVEHWNSLPQHVVSSNTVNTFKIRLDHHYLHCQGFK